MKIDLLDHGYIELVDSWGSDERIIEAARMSTGKGFLGWGPFECPLCHGDGVMPQTDSVWLSCSKCGGTGTVPGDEKLLRYLWEHKHTTPFEMAGVTVEVQAPILVYREWHRHRTLSYNEMSARYIPLPDVNYVPDMGRIFLNSQTNKQAGTVKGADTLTPEAAEAFRATVGSLYARLELEYQAFLSAGVPKELARIILPVGRYSRMRASGNLLNWLKFLTLRMDEGAQYEIRMYANALHDILMTLFPKTLELFDESRS